MLEQLLEILKEFEASDELFDTMARVMKKLYDSLVKAGFTESQAASIVASQGIGAKTS